MIIFNKFPSLDNFVEHGQNSFGFVRLLAAVAVVYSHTWLISGGMGYWEPLLEETGYPLGWHAVNVFFTLSGIVIAASLNRQPNFLIFFQSRILRIAPALIAVVIVTYLLCWVITSAPARSYWSLDTLFQYFGRNALLFGAGAKLPGVFDNNPIPAELNAPLWTLKFEVLSYFILAFIWLASMRLFPREKVKRWINIATIIIILSAGYFLLETKPYPDLMPFDHLWRFLFAFFLGVFAWLQRRWLPVSPLILLVLLLATSGLIAASDSYLIVPQIVTTAYLVLVLGRINFGWLRQFADKQDYSYGVYITSYPLQQFVYAYSGYTNPLVTFVLSLSLSLAVSALLWNSVEKPALMLKHRYSAIVKKQSKN